MTPPQPLPEIQDHDDTAFQILGAHVIRNRELAAKWAADDAAEKAKKAAQEQPPPAD